MTEDGKSELERQEKNEEVLKEVNEEKYMVRTIIRRKKWIGHILREESSLKDVIEGRMEENNRRGRKKIGRFTI